MKHRIIGTKKARVSFELEKDCNGVLHLPTKALALALKKQPSNTHQRIMKYSTRSNAGETRFDAFKTIFIKDDPAIIHACDRSFLTYEQVKAFHTHMLETEDGFLDYGRISGDIKDCFDAEKVSLPKAKKPKVALPKAESPKVEIQKSLNLTTDHIDMAQMKELMAENQHLKSENKHLSTKFMAEVTKNGRVMEALRKADEASIYAGNYNGDIQTSIKSAITIANTDAENLVKL